MLFFPCLQVSKSNFPHENLFVFLESVLRRCFFLEFASQLPHDGGAFYTTDTTESSRPHYSASWPPILYAAALWLTAGGHKTNDPSVSKNNVKSTGNNSNVGKGSVDSSSDRFHLLFGK